MLHAHHLDALALFFPLLLAHLVRLLCVSSLSRLLLGRIIGVLALSPADAVLFAALLLAALALLAAEAAASPLSRVLQAVDGHGHQHSAAQRQPGAQLGHQHIGIRFQTIG